MTTMSIKRILAFVLLAILVYGGCYVAVFGTRQYFQYSGAERTYNNMPSGQYQDMLNVSGSIDGTKKVTQLIFTEPVRREVLGFPIGRQLVRKYYILLLNPSEDKERSRYCVIAATDPDDIKQLDALKDGGSADFEFRGIIHDMPLTIHKILTERLQEIYDTDFNIYVHKKVEKYIVPYTIYIKNGEDDNLLLPIIAGGAAALIGAAAIVLLAINTYRRNHRY